MKKHTWEVWIESLTADIILCYGSRSKCLTFYNKHGKSKAGLHLGYWLPIY